MSLSETLKLGPFDASSDRAGRLARIREISEAAEEIDIDVLATDVREAGRRGELFALFGFLKEGLGIPWNHHRLHAICHALTFTAAELGWANEIGELFHRQEIQGWMGPAILGAGERGFDISDMLHAVVEWASATRVQSLARFLGSAIAADPTRANGIFEAVRIHGALTGDLLADVIGQTLDRTTAVSELGPVLPALLELVSDEREAFVESGLYGLAAIASDVPEVGAHGDVLDALRPRATVEGARRLGEIAMKRALFDSDLPRARAVATDSCPNYRQGAISGLSSIGSPAREHQRILWEALLDYSPDVRNVVARTLCTTARRQEMRAPESDFLEALFSRVLESGVHGEVLEVLDSMPEDIRALAIEAGVGVVALSSEVRLSPCDVCFSASQSTPNLNTLRPHLEPILPDFTGRYSDCNEQHFACCRHCGIAYVYSYAYDSSWGPPAPQPSQSFHRLRLQDALRRLPEPLKSQFEEGLDERVGRLRSCLQHGRRDVRRLAAGLLANFELARRHWPELESMLRHADPAVCRETLWRCYWIASFAEAFLDILGELLGSPDEHLRALAARHRVRWFLHTGDQANVDALVSSNDPLIARGAGAGLKEGRLAARYASRTRNR